MPQKYILSFDAGTSGVKAVLVSMDGGIAGMTAEGYSLYCDRPDWAEQEPEEYWHAVCAASARVMMETGIPAQCVAGVAFATQWKGMIPIDRDGNVLRRSIIWLDTRAKEQAQTLSRRMGRAFSPRDYWTRMMWFRDNEPELYEKTECFLEANGYLKYRACGVRATDISNHFTRSPLPAVQAFFDEIMCAAQLDADSFPPLVGATERVGGLTKTAAAQMGLNEGTPVFGGLCDIPAVAVGAGASGAGKGHLYLGSSGWLGLTRPVGDMNASVPVLLSDENWLHLGGMQSVCMSYDWCINTLYRDTGAEKRDVYALVEKELSGVEPGSNGLVAIPLLRSEAAPFPAGMRASFINANTAHGREHFTNAVLEGISRIFRMRKASIENGAGVALDTINAVGGGTLNAHWMQIFADMLNAQILVPENARYAGALGAAYCAMVGLGECASFDECAARTRIAARYTPRPQAAAAYDRLVERWDAYYEAVKSVETGL